MKKLLLFLLVSTIGFSQNVVEIRLVDQNVGIPSSFGENNTIISNDAGLNAILETHNATAYIYKMGHFFPSYENKYGEIRCENCNAEQLKNDLLAYSAVIEKARVTVSGSYFEDCLTVEIQSATIGNPIGVNNGIIVTNDVGLNQIFQDFNVFHYAASYPGSTNTTLQRVYGMVCNCDNNSLKAALDNYNTVINQTQFVNPIYLLNNTAFEKEKAIISPNPFSTNFTIQTEQAITTYSLYDINGKQLINTISKAGLDNLASQLNSGVYFLTLQFESGQQSNYKVVKK